MHAKQETARLAAEAVLVAAAERVAAELKRVAVIEANIRKQEEAKFKEKLDKQTALEAIERRRLERNKEELARAKRDKDAALQAEEDKKNEAKNAKKMAACKEQQRLLEMMYQADQLEFSLGIPWLTPDIDTLLTPDIDTLR